MLYLGMCTPSAEDRRRGSCKGVALTLLGLGLVLLVFPLAVFVVPYLTIRNGRSTRSTTEVTKITSTTKSTTTTIPPSFGVLYSYDPDVPIPMEPPRDLCSLPIRMRETFPGINQTSHPFIPDERMLQHRRIFCFFDSQYWREQEFYHAENLPTSYCTDVVFGTRALYDEYSPEAKGSESSYRRLRTPITHMQIAGKLRHRGQIMSVYEAIGGERRDSHNFSTFLSVDTSRFVIADFYTTGRKNTVQFALPPRCTGLRTRAFFVCIYRIYWFTSHQCDLTVRPEKAQIYLTYADTHLARSAFLVGNVRTQGVYLDWEYPGDNCGGPNDTDNMIAFINDLRSLNLKVILAVPPEPTVLSSYHLYSVAPLVEYVVVKTHTLRLSGAVYCSGARRYAAHVFSYVRRMMTPRQRHKLAYSISVAPDTFMAREAVMGAVSLGPSSWEDYTKKAGKTHYAALCRLNVTRFPEHPECVMVHQGNGRSVKIATFAGPEELRIRMRKSYDDGMGDVPIFVYDIDLDDFKGSCPTRVMSPLIRTLAVTTYNT